MKIAIPGVGSGAGGSTTSQRSGTVFIADDDASFRHSLATLLAVTGLTAKPFASAGAFLEDYAPNRPECLILDMRLPGMSGLELLAELATRHIDIPAIIVSACSDVAWVEEARAAGAFDYIVKPYNAVLLLGRIRDALDNNSRTLGRG